MWKQASAAITKAYRRLDGGVLNQTPNERLVKNWYLVHAKPRQESVARENLDRQNYQVYLPLARLYRKRGGRRVLVIEPLFPRYLFINLNTETDNWAPIRSTVGVSSLVRFGLKPAVVPDDLVAYLQSRDDASGVQDLPPPDLRLGQRVRFREGPMMGYEGIFVARTGNERVVVLMQLLGKPKRVIAKIEQMESAD